MSDCPLGVFGAIGLLEEQDILSKSEISQIKLIRSWFNKNLPTPPDFETYDGNPTKRARAALSWFRDSASECVERIRELVVILENHGFSVRMLTTERPGYILYEDAFQVLAKPFADTPT